MNLPLAKEKNAFVVQINDVLIHFGWVFLKKAVISN